MPTVIEDFGNALQQDAHARFQAWRRKNASGYVLQIKSRREAMLHRTQCSHFGGTEWDASPEGDLGKKPKKCCATEAPLIKWCEENNTRIKYCSDCFKEQSARGYDPVNKFVGTDDEIVWKIFSPPSGGANLSTDEYVRALTELKLTDHQLDMLRIHFASPGHVITARQLGLAMGYENWKPINIHYGRLGRLIGEKLGLPSDEKLSVICTFSKDSSGDECELTLRDEMVTALEKLGVVAGDFAPLQEEMPITKELAEGAAYQVQVNAYERNPIARAKAIAHHGLCCGICGFRFGDVYGQHAEKYIQVHHLIPLSSIKSEYVVDPINDLLPVCANCHAVIHLKSPPYTPDEMKEMLVERKTRRS